MPDEITAGSAAAGSSEDLIKNDPATGANGAGESGQPAQGEPDQGDASDFDYKKGYEELESKLGAQGGEVGEYRKFFKDIEPLLNKLEGQPELVQAILDGKIDSKLASSVLDGSIKPEDAEAITKAHDEVKKDLGDKKYENTSAENIEKLVSGQLDKFRDEMTSTLKESQSLQSFEARVNDFIANTADFADYATNIEKWLDDHPEQDDIETAYQVVKGIALAHKAEEERQSKEGEDAKNMAANAAGGASQGAQVVTDTNIADQLIGNTRNPNVF